MDCVAVPCRVTCACNICSQASTQAIQDVQRVLNKLLPKSDQQSSTSSLALVPWSDPSARTPGRIRRTPLIDFQPPSPFFEQPARHDRFFDDEQTCEQAPMREQTKRTAFEDWDGECDADGMPAIFRLDLGSSGQRAESISSREVLLASLGAPCCYDNFR